MDRKLLDLLVSPDTRQPLSLLDGKGLEALNRAIAGYYGRRLAQRRLQDQQLRLRQLLLAAIERERCRQADAPQMAQAATARA